MIFRCPGCKANLKVGEDLFAEKVVVRCPECLQIFIAHNDESVGEADATGEATLLVSDRINLAQAEKQSLAWQKAGASLTGIRGPDQGIHLLFKKEEMVIGREEADLILTDPAVSRWHCRIFKQKNRYWIEDLGSTNGTLVNKKRIQRAELNHLDEIEIGQSLLVFSEYSQKQEVKAEDLSQEIEKLRKDETKITDKDKSSPLPKNREFYLEVMTQPGRARSYQISNPCIILGRGEEADIRLEDDEISRKHAMIEIFSKENVYLSDLASANGTFLNGVRIRSMRVIHGDKIRLGKTILKLVVKDLVDEE